MDEWERTERDRLLRSNRTQARARIRLKRALRKLIAQCERAMITQQPPLASAVDEARKALKRGGD